MGKTYSDEALATRIFVISMVGVGAFIAVVFVFIL